MTESSRADDNSCMVWSRCKVGTERKKVRAILGNERSILVDKALVVQVYRLELDPGTHVKKKSWT